MSLAYVTMTGRGRIDDLIAEVVDALSARGLRLAGTVRATAADPRAHPCDMDLRVLPDGRRFRISQPLGTAAKGCRLDGGVIESIASAVEQRMPGADLLIINKFGKLEAHGRGLCPAIAMAVEMGLPTLVGVNEMNLPGFVAFSGGVAASLAPDRNAILDWCAAAVSVERFATA